MGPKTWEEKLQALRNIEYRVGVHMKFPGDWFCDIPGVMVDRYKLVGWCGNGDSPEKAVKDAWDKFTNLPKNMHIRLQDGRNVRWDPMIGLVPVS